MFNEIIKERNDDEKKQTSSYDDQYKSMSGMQNKMSKSMSSYKTPSMPKISMPKF